MFDCHIHTDFSTDSDMTINDAVKRAYELDTGLIITEHMDLNYPEEGLFTFNIDEFFNKYLSFRGDRLLLGIEMGMQDSCVEECRKLANDYSFDYIIGSIHLVNGEDIFMKEYYEGRTKLEAYTEYFQSMLECIRLYDFTDSLGHIDYIARYANYDDNEIYCEDFTDIIDEILKTAVFSEKSLELNTRRLDNKPAVKNLIGVYKRFYELGGKTVVLGSDSHTSDAIGKNFKTALEIAELCGLKPVYYKNRKVIYI